MPVRKNPKSPQNAHRAIIPIVRAKSTEDDIAAKALRIESGKRQSPKQGKAFNPSSNKKYR